MSPRDGGPAFPRTVIQDGGVTVRDYFAAAALQGAAMYDMELDEFRATVRRCYEFADAMLQAREEQPG